MKTELRTIPLLLGLSIIVASLGAPRAAASTNMLIPRNSMWKYNNLNQDLGTAWLDLNYDDTGWTNAVAPLGDNIESGEQQITAYGGTAIDIGPTTSRYPTIYFRKFFWVTNVTAYEGLTLRIMRDDAAFVYLNGHFLMKSGCGGDFEPDPPDLPHTNYCSTGGRTVAGGEEITYFEYHIVPT